MKRVAVFSDTHGRFTRLPAALDKIQKAGGAELLLHLGDYGNDAETIADKLGVPFVAVRGNNDYFSDLPRKKVVQIEDASILLVHGDAYYNLSPLIREAKRERCAAVLFGHTHVPLLQADGALLIVNPGSLSLPRQGCPPSFALLEIDGTDVNVKMVSVD
jgi:putative phosphoesterase